MNTSVRSTKFHQEAIDIIQLWLQLQVEYCQSSISARVYARYAYARTWFTAIGAGGCNAPQASMMCVQKVFEKSYV